MSQLWMADGGPHFLPVFMVALALLVRHRALKKRLVQHVHKFLFYSYIHHTLLEYLENFGLP